MNPAVERVHLVGTRAVLVELADLDSVLALDAALRAEPLPGQLDVLPAATTVLVKTDSPRAARNAAALIPALNPGPRPADAGQLITVEVHYDGADLAEVARLTDRSVDAVIAAHTAQTWTAAFGGFAPGFAYLRGQNASLNVPRRDSPRPAVPAGSVALAGEYCAIYPRRSPGGWQLLGRTGARLWDLDRADPALIRPQDRVRFVAVKEQAVITTAPSAPALQAPPTAAARLEVLDPGPQSLIQDLGRVGHGSLGVGTSGSADRASSRQANRLVGNPAGAAVIENLAGSLQVRALDDVVLALCGAQARLSIIPPVDEGQRVRPQPRMNEPFALLAGEVLELKPTGRGLRSYLAVRGGFLLEPVLGSVATDTLAGLGPKPLSRAEILAVGSDRGCMAVGHPEPSTLPRANAQGDYELRIVPGPRDDWFMASALAELTSRRWFVESDSDRVGMRLGSEHGAPLTRVRGGELASEGMVCGALQVPPSGFPILFLTDHPVTGGYPVIAVVVAEDIGAAAQLPPGSGIRFVPAAAPASPRQDSPRLA